MVKFTLVDICRIYPLPPFPLSLFPPIRFNRRFLKRKNKGFISHFYFWFFFGHPGLFTPHPIMQIMRFLQVFFRKQSINTTGEQNMQSRSSRSKNNKKSERRQGFLRCDRNRRFKTKNHAKGRCSSHGKGRWFMRRRKCSSHEGKGFIREMSHEARKCSSYEGEQRFVKKGIIFRKMSYE